MRKKDLNKTVIPYFISVYPLPKSELEFVNIYELAVSVILSAQCTDKRVNMITPALFRKYPGFHQLAQGSYDEIYGLIKSCSYPNNKTKHLLGLAQAIVNQYGGRLPDDLDEMQKLPGIGRKSANVIAAVGFGKNTMPVDTHVFRVSQRMGLVTPSKTPLEVEKKLIAILPESMLPDFHHWLILHGRYVCKARNPICVKCGLTTVCNYFNSVKPT